MERQSSQRRQGTWGTNSERPEDEERIHLRVSHAPSEHRAKGSDQGLHTSPPGALQPALHSWCACVPSHFSCVRLCHPVDCSQAGSSVHGILQAGILKWVATPSSRRSSWPRDRTHVPWHPLHWLAGSLLLAPPGKPPLICAQLELGDIGSLKLCMVSLWISSSFK